MLKENQFFRDSKLNFVQGTIDLLCKFEKVLGKGNAIMDTKIKSRKFMAQETAATKVKRAGVSQQEDNVGLCKILSIISSENNQKTPCYNLMVFFEILKLFFSYYLSMRWNDVKVKRTFQGNFFLVFWGMGNGYRDCEKRNWISKRCRISCKCKLLKIIHSNSSNIIVKFEARLESQLLIFWMLENYFQLLME